jgi:hypothetical protein
MGFYELPKLDAFIAQPKNKVKFEKWKAAREVRSE